MIVEARSLAAALTAIAIPAGLVLLDRLAGLDRLLDTFHIIVG